MIYYLRTKLHFACVGAKHKQIYIHTCIHTIFRKLFQKQGAPTAGMHWLWAHA